MVAVVESNPILIAYYTQETALRAAETVRNTARDVATVVQLGLQIAQLGTYYNAADNAIDDRDDKIDAQLAFIDQLENLKVTQDLPMLNCKKDILTDLPLPTIDMCGSVIKMSVPSKNDGDAIELKSEQLSRENCGGVPSNWALHDGSLMAAKAGSYTGGIVANAEKRREESFRSSRTGLTRTAQMGLKSVFNAGDTLGKYAQAAAIHSGLADLYIQGFNSAGAGLGVTLGRLADGGNTQTIGTQTQLNTGVSLDAGTANNVQGLA